MLKSSLFLLLLVNIFFNNIFVIFIATLILIILNLRLKIDIIENVKKIRFLFFLYFMTSLFHIFYMQEGHVIFKVYNFYLTEEGVRNFILNFLRIINLLLISWIVTTQKMLNGKFSKYQNIIENVIDLVPVSLILIKKRMKIKWFFRYILKQIKVKK